MAGKEVYIPPEGDSEINQPTVEAVIRGRGSRVKINGMWVKRGPNYATVVRDPVDGMRVIPGRPAGDAVMEEINIGEIGNIPALSGLKTEILEALGKKGRWRSEKSKG